MVSEQRQALKPWGWDEGLEKAFVSLLEEQSGELLAGRITCQLEDTFTVVSPKGTLEAHPAGVLFHRCTQQERPGVGDWVAVEMGEDDGHLVTSVLPRRSCFMREAPGGRGVAQVVATNVDTVFVVSPVSELNLNRIERFLVAIHSSGASPCVVLSKADLVSEQQLLAATTQVRSLEQGLKVLCSRAPWEHAQAVKEEFQEVFEPALTYALVGSSGAGKSTLLNTLAGQDLQETGEVREGDGKGRHVTTFRQLFALENGALVMDTPGMREFALWSDEGGLETVFSDITRLSGRCRFSDCAHLAEPGCAVSEALQRGELTERRLDNWRGLSQEMAENEERRAHQQARRARSDLRRKKKRDRRFSSRK